MSNPVPNTQEATVLSNLIPITEAPCGSVVPFADGDLIVSQRLGVEFQDEDLRPAGRAEQVVLTSDGRHYNRKGWHEGPEAEPVRVERWDASGRIFHGWIDSVSRQLTQAG